jgi:hypothetical protein
MGSRKSRRKIGRNRDGDKMCMDDVEIKIVNYSNRLKFRYGDKPIR